MDASSEIGDNDSLSSVDMDDVYRYKCRVCICK